MKFYQLDNKSLEKELNTNLETGLTNEQVSERFAECGYNVQVKNVKKNTRTINPVCFVLLICVCLAYALSALFTKNISYLYYSFAFLGVFAVSQAILFAVNFVINKELNESFLNSNNNLAVIRNGNELNIKSYEIMYGDVVIIKKGDYIPFDGVIVSSNGLVTDESELGGQDVCSKHQGVIAEDNVSMSKLYNTVFCGSYVVHGEAKVVVTDICARVYAEKSGSNNKKQNKFNSKIIDISTIFSTIFILFCLIFSVVCGLISQDAVSVITFVILMLSLMFSGYIKTISLIVYKKAFINLNKKGIFLKSFNKINSINKVDYLIFNHSLLYENNAEIKGFIDSNDKLCDLSLISKSNFETFLYSAFCLNESDPLFSISNKMLKKAGVDFNEISSLCPSLLNKRYDDLSITVCARAYEGTNMLIAVGEYNAIKAISNNSFSQENIKSLYNASNEIIAVAIKKVDQIPNDLTVKLDNFTVVGAFGVDKKLNTKNINSIRLLKKCGVNTITLFPGNADALNNADIGFNSISFNDFKNISKQDLKNIDVVFDYDGDIDSIVNVLLKYNLYPSYVGEKESINDKVLNIAFDTDDKYSVKNSDVVISGSSSLIFESFYQTRRANYLLNLLFERSSLLYGFYIVIGVLFSLLYKELLVSPIIFAILFFICLPLSIFLKLYFKTSFKKIALKNNSDYPLNTKTITSVLLSTAIFVFVCVASKFIFNYQISSMFLTIAFITYLFVEFDGKENIYFSTTISAVFPLLISIVFSTPIAVSLNITPINFGWTIIAILLGIGLKFLFNFIYKKINLK